MASSRQAVQLGALEAFVERNAPKVVAVSYWFDPPQAESITVRFTGQRAGVIGRPGPRDEFMHEEKVDDIVAGSGPVSIIAKVRDVNPGEWRVNARMLPPEDGGRLGRVRARQPVAPVHPARWSWRRWRLSEGPAEPVRTCLAPLAWPPAVVVGSWPALVLVGIVVALVTQSLVISARNLQLGHVLTISLLTVLAGVIGGKAWFVVLHRGPDTARDGPSRVSSPAWPSARRSCWCCCGCRRDRSSTCPRLACCSGSPSGVSAASSPAAAPGAPPHPGGESGRPTGGSAHGEYRPS